MDNRIEELLADHREDIEQLRANLICYFRLCEDKSKRKEYRRRPPFALRLPHGDYIFVVKPTVNKSGGVVTLTDGIQIESLRTLDDRHATSVLNLLVHSQSMRKTRWIQDDSLSFDAAENLVELTKFFLIFPAQVFARSKDRCCCCARPLTDEISRARGIGPECLRIVNICWKQWFTPQETQQPLKLWRTVYDE